jgi:hypothetical protein
MNGKAKLVMDDGDEIILTELVWSPELVVETLKFEMGPKIGSSEGKNRTNMQRYVKGLHSAHNLNIDFKIQLVHNHNLSLLDLAHWHTSPNLS